VHEGEWYVSVHIDTRFTTYNGDVRWGVLATYGGHLELSAFAHLFQRNVKVIQPGLVYVIEWDAGGSGSGSSSRGSPPPLPTVADDDPMLDDREKRKLRRDKKRADKEKAILESGGQSSTSSGDTIYVA
jgi:OTU domain-containing protein 3